MHVSKRSLESTLKRVQPFSGTGVPSNSFPHTVKALAHTCAAGQGVVFAVVGFAAALVGTAMSNGLIAARSRLDKNFKSQNKPPNVILNAGTWAAHMGVSANLRYQVINGLDMVCAWLPRRFPPPRPLFRPFCPCFSSPTASPRALVVPRVSVRAPVHVCVSARACVRARMCVRACTRVCVFVSACVRAHPHVQARSLTLSSLTCI